jgi:hypothetical protein
LEPSELSCEIWPAAFITHFCLSSSGPGRVAHLAAAVDHACTHAPSALTIE